jgi:hypothetical protein
VPPTTRGVDEYPPKKLVTSIGNRHLTLRCPTFLELMSEVVVARVFARSWLWDNHPSPSAAADAVGPKPAAAATDTTTAPTASQRLPESRLFVCIRSPLT